MKGISDAYKLYRSTEKEPIDISTYRNITSSFIEFIIVKLSQGKLVDLPDRLGELHFAGRKIKPKLDEDGNIIKLSVDWKETLKNWKVNPPTKDKPNYVYHFNEHTCGVRYRFIWNRRSCMIKNKNFYIFIPARVLKRRFAQIVFREETEFIVR